MPVIWHYRYICLLSVVPANISVGKTGIDRCGSFGAAVTLKCRIVGSRLHCKQVSISTPHCFLVPRLVQYLKLFFTPVTMSAPESSAFLRRFRNNTEQSTRPVPGQIRVTRGLSDEVKETDSTKSASEKSNQVIIPAKSTPKSADAPKSTGDTTQPPPPQEKGKYVSTYRYAQFEKILAMENVDLNALRTLAWNGVPSKYRADVWQMLLGYLPTNLARRAAALERKRREYTESIATYFAVAEIDRTKQDEENLGQISIDLPRTSPNVAFFQQDIVQEAMKRILYIWSIRHPASGYVQGMNDLLTPLLLVSLQPFVEDPLRCDVAALEAGVMAKVEADAYWCLTKLMDNIQDHYTFGQPGLQRMTLRLQDLVLRLDAELHAHFQEQGVMFQFFTTRWMNCYLLRELPLRSILRLWDTYIAEEHGGFENFHVYVCVVLLKTFKEDVMKMEFQDIILFMQNLPTTDWDEEEVEPILSQAYILSTLFENSPSHLS